MNEAKQCPTVMPDQCVKNIFHYSSQNCGGNVTLVLCQGLINWLVKNDNNMISINEIVSEKI